MVAFLFWNIGKRPLQRQLARLAEHLGIDVLMLAECELSPLEVLSALNGGKAGIWSYPTSESRKLRVFTRLPGHTLLEHFNDEVGGLSIRLLKRPRGRNLILAIIHCPSRVNWDREDLHRHGIRLNQDILKIEDELGYRRTIVVGDLNMNPFDPGVAGAGTLHGVMTRQLADRESRIVSGRAELMFYNPMWAFFGDRTLGPPGTYYLRSSKPVNYYWNIYDQVLLRPAVARDLLDLEILTTDGQDSLLTKDGLPGGRENSDHLPLFFKVDV